MQERPAEGWRSLSARAIITGGLGGPARTMLDQIVGLILAILALIYLAYAMLRPERF